MVDTWKALLSSRKFWVGTVSVAAIAAAVTLVSLGKLPESALLPTISAITTMGLSVIGSIAWEDAAAKRAGGGGAPPTLPVSPSAPTPNSAPASAGSDPDSKDVPTPRS